MALRSINIRLEPELIAALKTAAEVLSAEKSVRLTQADVHRIALRELYARLGVQLGPQQPSEQGRREPPPPPAKKVRKPT